MKYLSLIILFTLISLGTWQVYRWQYKKQIEFKLSKPYEKLPTNIGKNDNYTKVYFTIKLDDNKPIYLYSGAEGYRLLLPGQIKKNKFVLINIGTVSHKNKLKIKKKQVIKGVILFNIKKTPIVKTYDEKSDIWFNIDTELISQKLKIKLEPYIVWAEETNIEGINSNKLFAVHNRHVEYIITWYGLTLILACYMICQLKKIGKTFNNKLRGKK
ncbi:MAG: SURF1 family protein [Rickettsiaceae bacterium H1]|nr:SURF1 family protein [Rickettsiaceae bacterium H1]